MQVRSVTSVDVHLWMVVVYVAHVMSGKQAWYGAMPLTAAGTQMPKYIDHRRQCVSCRLPVVERTDALSSMTSPEIQEISLDSAHNIVQGQTVNRKLCACWVAKNLTENKAQHMGLSCI